MNQSCYGLKSLKPFGDYFTYFNTKYLLNKIKQKAHGSVFDTITRSTLISTNSIKPDIKILSVFEETVEEIMSKLLNNVQQNRNLQEIRNIILPRLLSGEIHV